MSETTAELRSALRRYFAFPHFRPGQAEALQHIAAGRDTLVVMPTGSGKSLIYQLGALLQPDVTLVVSPLVALMKDQVDSLTRRHIPATFINSSLTASEQFQRLRGFERREYKILLVSPERLRNQAFLQTLSRVPVSLLVVDEAHCLSQWGHDFRPDYLHIAATRRQLTPHVTLALTATATPREQQEILRLLEMPHAQKLVMGFNRPNLSLEVYAAPGRDARLGFVRNFLSRAEGAGIIYTGSRKDAEAVADYARQVCKVNARHYHGLLDARTRAEVQDAFMAGSLELVVATNAFGMGIDRPDVRFVLHYTMPGSLEAYYQEAGRAGRDGLPARALLLYSASDTALHEHFINEAWPSEDELRSVHGFLETDASTNSPEPAAARRVHFSWEEAEAALGLSPTLIRVALELLETAQALRRGPDRMGGLVEVEVRELAEAALKDTVRQIAARRDHKRRLLLRMVSYAETDACRRRTMLDYFGDGAKAEALVCCDNCRARGEMAQPPAQARPAETQAERAALIVLQTVASLSWRVGKKKLAQILQGSEALEPAAYARVRNRGKLAALKQAEIESLIDQVLAAGCLKQVGGMYPTLELTPRGEQTLQNRTALPIRLRSVHAIEARQPAGPREAGRTVRITEEMLRAGLEPEKIAAERGLSVVTVYSHLERLVAAGSVELDQVMPRTLEQRIREAIETVGSVELLVPIKELLPPEVDFGHIRCVVAAWKRERVRQRPLPPEREAPPRQKEENVREVILSCVRALPGRLPRSGLAKLLVGSGAARMAEFRGHDFYNRLEGHTRTEVQAWVDELLAQGALVTGPDGHVMPGGGGAAATGPGPAWTLSGQSRAHRMYQLGEEGSLAAVPELIAALSDPQINVRRLAASALGKLRAAEAVEPLSALLARESAPQVKLYAIKALGVIGDARAKGALEEVLQVPQEPSYNHSAARASLRQLGGSA
jgi:ATP-dependent DNA helicase RecQ